MARAARVAAGLCIVRGGALPLLGPEPESRRRTLLPFDRTATRHARLAPVGGAVRRAPDDRRHFDAGHLRLHDTAPKLVKEKRAHRLSSTRRPALHAPGPASLRPSPPVDFQERLVGSPLGWARVRLPQLDRETHSPLRHGEGHAVARAAALMAHGSSACAQPPPPGAPSPRPVPRHARRPWQNAAQVRPSGHPAHGA